MKPPRPTQMFILAEPRVTWKSVLAWLCAAVLLAIICGLFVLAGCESKNAGSKPTPEEVVTTPAEVPMPVVDDPELAHDLNETSKDNATERVIYIDAAKHGREELRWMGRIAFVVGFAMVILSFVPVINLSGIRNAGATALVFATGAALLPEYGEKLWHQWEDQLYIAGWVCLGCFVAVILYRASTWLINKRRESQIENKLAAARSRRAPLEIAKHQGALAAVKRIDNPRIDNKFRKNELTAESLK